MVCRCDLRFNPLCKQLRRQPWVSLVNYICVASQHLSKRGKSLDIKSNCYRDADGFSSLSMQTLGMAAVSIEQAVTLLDFTQKPNIALLDEVVNCFYGTVGPQVSF